MSDPITVEEYRSTTLATCRDRAADFARELDRLRRRICTAHGLTPPTDPNELAAYVDGLLDALDARREAEAIARAVNTSGGRA